MELDLSIMDALTRFTSRYHYLKAIWLTVHTLRFGLSFKIKLILKKLVQLDKSLFL
jgi:hypothetical protein